MRPPDDDGVRLYTLRRDRGRAALEVGADADSDRETVATDTISNILTATVGRPTAAAQAKAWDLAVSAYNSYCGDAEDYGDQEEPRPE